MKSIFLILTLTAGFSTTSMARSPQPDPPTNTASFKQRDFLAANILFSLCPKEASALYIEVGAQPAAAEMISEEVATGQTVNKYKFLFKKYLLAPSFGSETWQLKALEVITPRNEPLLLDAPGTTRSVKCFVESLSETL